MHKLGTYVDRRIAAPIEAVIAATPELAWERDRNVLRASVRIGGVAAELEISAWSDFMTHVGVRPLSPRTHSWSVRRRERWFDGAHDLVDDLRGRIVIEEIILPDYDINIWDQRSA
jgi:hypothetical protein